MIERLLDRGCTVSGVHFDDPEVSADRLHAFCKTDLRNLSEIQSFAERIDPDAVISDQCDYSWFAASIVSEQLDLPGPELGTVQLTTNKILQRRHFDESDVLQPEFYSARTLNEARDAASNIGYPVIVKPVDNRGSIGVNRAENSEEIKEGFYEAIMNAHSREVIVEDFIDGIHITVDGYAFPESGYKSLALASKEMLGNDEQVAMDILYPGQIDEAGYEHVMECNRNVAHEAGISFGMTHAEYMLTDRGQCYLIEIANRGGGCFTSTFIVPAVSGIDITDQLIRDVSGEKNDVFDNPSEIEKNYALLSFFRLSPGQLSSFSGTEEILSMDGVLSFRMNVNEGDTIEETTTDANRHGFVITHGTSESEVRRLAEEAKQTLDVEYRSC